MLRFPALILCRDRLTPLLALIAWLERAGQTEIYLIDNDSSYPPLLEYFRTTPHRVIHLGSNQGPLAIWRTGLLSALNVTGRFIVSDPDVVPTEDCPDDAIDVLSEALDRFPDRKKAGLGLRIDDLPIHYPRRAEVIAQESQFWTTKLASGFYDAAIDTTFALYREREPWSYEPSVRTGPPYVARHTPWYTDPNHLTDEEAYYATHSAPAINTWRLTDTATSTASAMPKKLLPEESRPGVSVLAATYGCSDDEVDVTEKVQTLVHDGRLPFFVSNSLFTDPCPFRPKALHITYDVPAERRTRQIEFAEGTFVDTPDQGGWMTSPEPDDHGTRTTVANVEMGRELWSVGTNDVLVIVPTRSRPDKSVAFADAFFAHSTRSDLLFALDDDDPVEYPRLERVRYEINPRLRLVGTLNLVAAKYRDDYRYIAFMGDDNRIRTAEWDSLLIEAIENVPAGIAYGNDLLQGEHLPTAVLMKAEIVRTLGYMAPPDLIHLYMDNVWRELGSAVGSLRYRDDVIIEHLHYTAGKAADDAIYQETNSNTSFARDAAAFERYARYRLGMDVARLKNLMDEAAAKTNAEPSGLTILEATYGSSYGKLDVTAQVQALVRDGRLRFVVSNALLTDPSPNAVKTLSISYTQPSESRPYHLELQEGETADLSSPPTDSDTTKSAPAANDAASKLQAEYEARRSEWSDIVDHLPTLYEAVIRYPGAQVLELGVRTGTSTSALLAAVAAVGGHLWSVDIYPPQVPSWWADTDYWSLTVGDDLAEAVINTAPTELDVLFIDTSHAYEQTLAELRTYVLRVRAGGVVFCHDTEVEGPSGVGAHTPFPVARALDVFCEETGLTWINRPGSHGLGVIQIDATVEPVPAGRAGAG